MIKNLLANSGDIRDEGSIPGSGRSPGGEEMATYSTILAWRIPWTEEPVRVFQGHEELDTTEAT